MAGPKLTPRQERFVAEYLLDLNATAAYKRAGYAGKGNAAESAAARLLRNVQVSAAIAEAIAARSAKTGITAAQILNELAIIAFADQRHFCTWGPGGVKLKDSAGLGDQARAVAEVNHHVTEGSESIRCKLHDKVAALQLLGKHLGLFPNKVDHEHEHKGEVQLRVKEVVIERDKPTNR